MLVLHYLKHLLTRITEDWIDISYGHRGENSLVNIQIDQISYRQLQLAALTITANENIVFQSKKFLNYIYNYASEKERKEFLDINKNFSFLPTKQIDLSDIISKDTITPEELQKEINLRKTEIIKEVSVIVDNQEKYK